MVEHLYMLWFEYDMFCDLEWWLLNQFVLVDFIYVLELMKYCLQAIYHIHIW